jgi:putative aminopeptidase FrvX
VPGREEAIRALVREALVNHVDEIEVDLLGNLIAHKKGRGPKVVVAAHMDEIGFFVSHIDEENGFLRLEPVGGFDARTLIASRVVVHTESGPLLGLIGIKPIHILTEEEKKKEIRIQDLFVDLGLPGKEVKERVRIGDPVTMYQTFAEVGELVSGKALDDRVGLYVGIEALRRLKDHKADIYFVATVQEEVGLRGARASAFAVAPEIGVALDTTLACDMPGVQPHEQITKLGKGVAIKVKDSASISHPGLVRFFGKARGGEKHPLPDGDPPPGRNRCRRDTTCPRGRRCGDHLHSHPLRAHRGGGLPQKGYRGSDSTSHRVP